MINGAGGSAGSFAVQLSKLYGAEVTGVDNTGKMDFLRSLGADHVIDYTRQDFTKNGKQYDLILDVIAHRSVIAYTRALNANGITSIFSMPMGFGEPQALMSLQWESRAVHMVGCRRGDERRATEISW